VTAPARAKYDPLTRLLHAGLATGVVIEMLLQAVMRVPAGVGLGVDDWHREAFELHAHFGPTVAVLCLLHWIWICLPWSRPGAGYLFPWLHSERRPVLRQEFHALLRFQPPRGASSPLVGAVQGLGLLAVTGSVAGGVVSYLGYFAGWPLPSRVLHWTALEQIFMSWLVWAFVVGHVSMASWHRIGNGAVGNRNRIG
jgi:hypothetical protein